MFMKHNNIEPAHASQVLKAAEAAARAIPPAFPLEGAVAVNSFLGQSGEDLPHAAARLARVAGVRVTARAPIWRPRSRRVTSPMMTLPRRFWPARRPSSPPIWRC